MDSEPTGFSEISAISCVPLNPAKHASRYIIAAYWNSNIVEIFSISEIGLKSESKTPPLPAVVRSILLFNFGNDVSPKGADHHAFLLAGLGDGSVASMLWKDNKLTDLTVVSLGHAPVSLTPFQVDDKHTVLAAGNRATVFFYDSKKHRLANSPIMLKVGIFVCSFLSRQNSIRFKLGNFCCGSISDKFIWFVAHSGITYRPVRRSSKTA